MHEQTLNCSRYSPCEMLAKASGNHSSGGKATGEQGPATESRTVTYALMHSLSQTSHRTSDAPLSLITPYVLDADVLLTAAA